MAGIDDIDGVVRDINSIRAVLGYPESACAECGAPRLPGLHPCVRCGPVPALATELGTPRIADWLSVAASTADAVEQLPRCVRCHAHVGAGECIECVAPQALPPLSDVQRNIDMTNLEYVNARGRLLAGSSRLDASTHLTAQLVRVGWPPSVNKPIRRFAIAAAVRPWWYVEASLPIAVAARTGDHSWSHSRSSGPWSAVGWVVMATTDGKQPRVFEQRDGGLGDEAVEIAAWIDRSWLRLVDAAVAVVPESALAVMCDAYERGWSPAGVTVPVARIAPSLAALPRLLP